MLTLDNLMVYNLNVDEVPTPMPEPIPIIPNSNALDPLGTEDIKIILPIMPNVAIGDVAPVEPITPIFGDVLNPDGSIRKIDNNSGDFVVQNLEMLNPDGSINKPLPDDGSIRKQPIIDTPILPPAPTEPITPIFVGDGEMANDPIRYVNDPLEDVDYYPNADDVRVYPKDPIDPKFLKKDTPKPTPKPPVTKPVGQNINYLVIGLGAILVLMIAGKLMSSKN